MRARGVVPGWAASQRSETSTTPAAPSVTWQQSLRRSRPDTIGLAVLSASDALGRERPGRGSGPWVVLRVAEVQLADGPQVGVVEAVPTVVGLGDPIEHGRPDRVRVVGLVADPCRGDRVRAASDRGAIRPPRRAPGRSRSDRPPARPSRPARPGTPRRRRPRDGSPAHPTAPRPPWPAWPQVPLARESWPNVLPTCTVSIRCVDPGVASVCCTHSPTRSQISRPSRVCCARSRLVPAEHRYQQHPRVRSDHQSTTVHRRALPTSGQFTWEAPGLYYRAVSVLRPRRGRPHPR